MYLLCTLCATALAGPSLRTALLEQSLTGHESAALSAMREARTDLGS